MIVLITGMMRSGSTIAFNIVRQLLSQHGEHVHCEPADDIAGSIQNNGLSADHLIYKQHLGSAFSWSLIKHECAKGICTYRDPEEAMASWMQVFGYSFDEAMDAFRGSIDFIEFQRGRVLFVNYESIQCALVSVIKRISEYLGVASVSQTCHEIAHSLDRTNVQSVCMAATTYDPITFFHRNHIRGSNAIKAERYFTARQRLIIHDELRVPYSEWQENP